MTERERWIVYPLLFLALGAALRDKLSEHTKTKRIECQELIVFGEDSPGMPPVPLVQIGAVQRKSADAPHIGQIVVSGQLIAEGIQAENIQATNINSGNYFFRRVPFAPTLLRAMPGVSPTDWLRALQQQATDAAQDQAEPTKPPTDDKSSQPATEPPPTEPPASATTPPAE